jgi:hypothetical protein
MIESGSLLDLLKMAEAHQARDLLSLKQLFGKKKLKTGIIYIINREYANLLREMEMVNGQW